ncbi:MAG: transporter associated domain-containing protein [Halocynthiibacter sp.]
MGDSIDGSSNAAQRAQSEDIPNSDDPMRRSRPNFLQRLFGTQEDVIASNAPEKDKVDVMTPKPGMVNLRRLRVDDVAIPKAEIIAVASDIRKDDLVSVFRDCGLTRLPVYEGTLDTPIGLVHLKDFSLNHGFNGTGERFSMKNLIRPLLYVPPSMPLGILLQKMQAERIHMALVIDEYGGVDGVVTIEDLIEQVVGEIEDEHDIEEDVLWQEEPDGSFCVEARAALDEFQEVIGKPLITGDEDEEVETMGGLVFLLAGHVPTRGEVIRHPNGMKIEVMEADPRRIKRLRVWKDDRTA